MVISSVRALSQNSTVITVAFFCSIVVVLSAGLWPFHAPKNELTWVDGQNGIEMGPHGSAISSARVTFPATVPAAYTIEAWIKPARLWMTGSVLTFYRREEKEQFTVEQNYRDLILLYSNGGVPANDGSLEVDDTFSKPGFLLTITFDGHSTRIYVDGKLVLTSSSFPVTNRNLSGQIILGNSALRNHSWEGEITGLAIYDTALSGDEIEKNMTAWVRENAHQLNYSERLVALYRFSEGSGSVIHSAMASGPNLDIPSAFEVVDQLRFESPFSEAHAEGNYIKNALVNVLGFVPLGFVSIIFYLHVWRTRRALFAATATGLAVSLVIEFVQSFLPTRFSGVTDLFTNALGAWIGAISYVVLRNIVDKRQGAESSRTQPA